MIDCHCHLLPGIDDGAEDMAQALDMARLAVADGISHAVVTPHIQPGRWPNTRAVIEAATESYRQALAEAGIPLRVSCGAEVRISDEIFAQLAGDQLVFLGTLDGDRLLLIEFPPSTIVPGTDKLFHWLLQRNIRPVIAHPERNREIARTPEKLKPFLAQGCMAQLTAASLLGRFGDSVQAAAEHFIAERQVHLVASDAHNTTVRAPQMSAARARVVELAGEERARELFETTPAAIIDGQ